MWAMVTAYISYPRPGVNEGFALMAAVSLLSQSKPKVSWPKPASFWKDESGER